MSPKTLHSFLFSRQAGLPNKTIASNSRWRQAHLSRGFYLVKATGLPKNRIWLEGRDDLATLPDTYLAPALIRQSFGSPVICPAVPIGINHPFPLVKGFVVIVLRPIHYHSASCCYMSRSIKPLLLRFYTLAILLA